MVGRTLAHYEITEKIGAGGMGEVYRATDTRLGRTVAIKILPGHHATNPDARARFEREARAISNLSHPNICTLHDVGQADGVDFLVMEHLEGETLAQRLGRDRIPLDRALRFGAEIARALDAAHRRGIVHRDLKPGNVMLTRNGVKLLDFGLAKLMETTDVPDATAAVTDAQLSEPLTERGTILGTFRYMAPEQLEGKDADSRTDLFALGAVLYEMAAGRPAFEGKSRASLIAAIMEREPAPVSAVEPLAPPAFDRTIRRCLAKDPDARWQSAADVAAELEWIAEESSRAGVPAVVSSRRRSRERMLWAAVIPLGLLAAVLGVAAARLASRPAPVLRASIPPPEGRIFDLNGYQPSPAAVSPDGKRIVFAIEGAAKDTLHVRALDAEAPRFLAEAAGLAYPFWSPDGRAVAYFAEGELRRVDASGGPSLRLCEVENGKGGTWNRDDVIVFAHGPSSPLFRVSATGGDPVQVTELDSSRAETGHRLPWFLPDGRRFLFFARRTATPREPGDIMLGGLDGETPRKVAPGSSQALFAEGRLLFVRDGTLLAQRFDAARAALLDDPFPLASSVEVLGGAACAAFSVSGTGVLTFHPDQPEEVLDLVWHDRDGRPAGTLGEPAFIDGLRISPDGRHVALDIQDPDTGRRDLWIHDVDRDVRTRFTFDPLSESSPVWSPDGETLYFAANRSGRADLYRKSLAGPDAEELLFASPEDKFPQFVSADGGTLVFSREDDLWALPLEGQGEPALLLESAGAAARSPDGRWMCWVSAEAGRPEAYLAAFPRPGRRWQVSSRGSFGAGWWSERELLFVDMDGALLAADVAVSGGEVAIGRPRVLIAAPNAIVNGDPHPDGQRTLLVVRRREPPPIPLSLVLNWPAIRRS